MVYVKLVPVVKQERPAEMLFAGIEARPCLELKPNDAPLPLGRNQRTKVSDQNVSRKLGELRIVQEKVQLFVRKQPSLHRMHLRGQRVNVPSGTSIEVHDQDRIALNLDQYEYVVLIKEDENALNQHAVANPPAAENVASMPDTQNQSQEKDDDHFQYMTEEAICAVCMDIIVEARSIDVCGHVFCRTCLTQLTECPNCRHPVASSTPAKHMDSMIWHMMMSRMFEPDDAQQYLTRSNGRNLSDEEMARILSGPRASRKRHREQESAHATLASATPVAVPSSIAAFKTASATTSTATARFSPRRSPTRLARRQRQQRRQEALAAQQRHQQGGTSLENAIRVD